MNTIDVRRYLYFGASLPASMCGPHGGMVVLDRHYRVVEVRDTERNLLGEDPDKIIGRSLFELDHGRWRGEEAGSGLFAVLHRCLSVMRYKMALGDRALEIDAMHIGGRQIEDDTVLIAASPFLDPSHEARERAGRASDRARAIIQLSARSHGDELLPRLQALTVAEQFVLHDEASNELRALLQTVVARAAPEWARRITLEGPAVILPEAQTVTLALIVHELTRNALNHGALGDDNGTVTLRWTLQPDQRLAVEWHERCGSPVAITEALPHFGLCFIARAARDELDGRAELVTTDNGFACRMDIAIP